MQTLEEKSIYPSQDVNVTEPWDLSVHLLHVRLLHRRHVDGWEATALL